MRTSKLFIRLIVVMVSAGGLILFLKCGESPVTGGSSDTEVSAEITGVARDVNGKSVQGAIVRLRPVDYLSGDTITNKPVTEAICTTDANGKYQIDSIEAGIYKLEVSSGDSFGCIEECVITDQECTLEMKLMPLGTVAGNVDLRNGMKMFYKKTRIQVYGTAHAATIDSTGFFMLKLPAGEHKLRISVDESLYDELDINVTVQASQYKNIGYLTLDYVPMQLCWEYTCDSSIVRAFLDTNGYSDVAVEDVSVKEYNRIRELHLRGFTLTSSMYLLAQLNWLKVLDLGRTGITDSCHFLFSMGNSLEELRLDSNNITGLSMCIEGLFQLNELDVSSNQLTDLPKHLPVFNFKYLNISDNYICNLPHYFQGPVDIINPGWKESQKCGDTNL